MAPAKMGTIGPYLRYRKWKRKDDKGYERLEEVEETMAFELFGQLPDSLRGCEAFEEPCSCVSGMAVR
jgi:hypothetical protein